MVLPLAGSVGCHTPPVVAPKYEVKPNGVVSDADLPLALTLYVFSPPASKARRELAKPLADRFLLRSKELFAQGRERHGLAAVRLAAMLLRTNSAAPAGLSDPAVAALEDALKGPAARGDEGASVGLYQLWGLARPADPRPKQHLDALSVWTASKQGVPSPLVDAGRNALREADAFAFAINRDGLPHIDTAMYEWMDRIVAFKEGERVKARYEDEIYWAVFGFHTVGDRLVASHLRDGDIGGAIEATTNPATQGFVSEPLRRALLDAGSEPNVEGFETLIAVLAAELKKGEGLDGPMTDSILGVGLAATAAYPREPVLAEVIGRTMLGAGAGDATPAIYAYSLLGTQDDPRRPAARDLGRALSLTASAVRDYADREDYEAARRTFGAAMPLLQAADEIGGVSPSSAQIKTIMALVEGEAGNPAVSLSLFNAALGDGSLPIALAGRARIEAWNGDLAGARAHVAKALSGKWSESDPLLYADIEAFSGDLARRAGDVDGARAAYEDALRLITLAQTKKLVTSGEAAGRIARILSRFADAEAKEDDAASLAEATANDPRVLVTSVTRRFLRAFRGPDAHRARIVFHRVDDLKLPADELVQAAVIARAIAKRSGAAVDADIGKALAAASTRDDRAGRLARFALGQLPAAELLEKSKSPRHLLQAKLVIAMTHFGDGGLAAAKSELELVAHADIIGSLEAELALELLEPDHAAIIGAPKSP